MTSYTVSPFHHLECHALVDFTDDQRQKSTCPGVEFFFIQSLYMSYGMREIPVFEKTEQPMEEIARKMACVSCVRAIVPAGLLLDQCSF